MEGLPFVPRPGSAERRRLQQDPDSLIRAPAHICPRCTGPIPQEGHIGEWEGARSRTDDRTEICSPCGQHEAAEDMSGAGVTPQSHWPMKDRNPHIRTPERWMGIPWENGRSVGRQPLAPAPMPREVPDLRLHLMERWLPSGVFTEAIPADRGTVNGLQTAEWERETLKKASLWWVRDEMVKLCMAAAKSIPGDIKASEVELPGKMNIGFAVLGAPYVGIDSEVPDHQVSVNAFTWAYSTVGDVRCLSISFYQYFDFAGGLGPQELQDSIATGAIYEAGSEYIGEDPRVPGKVAARLRGGAWVPLGRSDWPLEDTLEGFELELSGGIHTTKEYNERRKASLAEDYRFFAAFCVLVNHKLSQIDMQWAPRAVHRRAERSGIDTEASPSHVRLIRLREVRSAGARDPEAEKRHVEWTHRWIVNGHMAWRRCGPKGESRRLVFVSPYVKGPKDKPLVVKDEVRVWTR